MMGDTMPENNLWSKWFGQRQYGQPEEMEPETVPYGIDSTSKTAIRPQDESVNITEIIPPLQEKEDYSAYKLLAADIPEYKSGIKLGQEKMESVYGSTNKQDSKQAQGKQAMATQLKDAATSGASQADMLSKEIGGLIQSKSSRDQEQMGELKNLLKQYQNNPQKFDLSPILSLADAWTGSNLARSYTPPQTHEQKMKDVAGMQALINKHESNLMDNKIDLLKLKQAAEKSKIDQENDKALLAARLKGTMAETKKTELESKKIEKDLSGTGKKTMDVVRISNEADELASDPEILTMMDTYNSKRRASGQPELSAKDVAYLAMDKYGDKLKAFSAIKEKIK
jgi:hypothetical protein